MAAAAGRYAGMPRVQGRPRVASMPLRKEGRTGRVGSALLEQAEAGDTRQSDRTAVRLLAREWRANGAEMVHGFARFDMRSKSTGSIISMQRYHGYHHQSNGDSHDRRR
jgi:hypothetical protein